MSIEYILKNIRAFLTEGFTADELRRFCYDTSSFRPVYNQLALDTGKLKIIDLLLEYADTKSLLDDLLKWGEESNPTKYAKYKPYYNKMKYKFDWLGEQLDGTAFYKTGGGWKTDGRVDFTLQEEGLIIKGTRVNYHIWVDRKLPKEFRISLHFKALDKKCAFAVGIGNGKDWKPNYHLAMSIEWTSFKKFRDGTPQQGESDADYLNYHITPRNYDYPMQPNITRSVVLERDNSGVRVYLDQTLVMRVPNESDPELKDLYDFNYVCFSAVTNMDKLGSILIEQFSIEAL